MRAKLNALFLFSAFDKANKKVYIFAEGGENVRNR